jgi:hypothetical protein
MSTFPEWINVVAFSVRIFFFYSLIVKFDEVMGEPDVFLFIYDPLRRCDGATYPARLVNFPWYVV